MYCLSNLFPRVTLCLIAFLKYRSESPPTLTQSEKNEAYASFLFSKLTGCRLRLAFNLTYANTEALADFLKP